MRQELAEWAEEADQLSPQRRGGADSSGPSEFATLRYEHHRDPQETLRVRLRESAGTRVRYGYVGRRSC